MKTVRRIPTQGDIGIHVGVLQTALNEHGANPKLKVDNHFGQKTQTELCIFQTRSGIRGVGSLNESTLSALGIRVVAKTLMPTRTDIADMIVSIIQSDINAGLRETNGKNRSSRIDRFNLRTRVPLGSPYCASGGWCAIDDACQALGLLNPVPASASSQLYKNDKIIPMQYIRLPGSLGLKGDVAILQSVKEPNQGHYTTLSENQKSHPRFETVEYNTDGSGSRDGDGAYNMTRSTVDLSPENSGKRFICFTDIPQWIYDSNI